MPARLKTQTRVVQGNRAIVVGADEGWRFGPVEGRWYIGMLIFAIIVLLYNLAWPWAYETATGQSWRFRHNAPAAVQSAVVMNPRPINVPPLVVVQQMTPPAPTVPADPTAGMSPEDLRLYERLVLRK